MSTNRVRYVVLERQWRDGRWTTEAAVTDRLTQTRDDAGAIACYRLDPAPRRKSDAVATALEWEAKRRPKSMTVRLLWGPPESAMEARRRGIEAAAAELQAAAPSIAEVLDAVDPVSNHGAVAAVTRAREQGTAGAGSLLALWRAASEDERRAIAREVSAAFETTLDADNKAAGS